MSGRVNKDQYYLPNGELSESYYDEHEEIDKEAYGLPNGEFDWRAYCNDAECDFNCELCCEECGTCPNQREQDEPTVEFHDECIDFCEYACFICGACTHSWHDDYGCFGDYEMIKERYHDMRMDEIEYENFIESKKTGECGQELEYYL